MLPAGISSSFAVSLSAFAPDRENTQLREVGVARNHDGAFHGERSVRGIANVVANRFTDARE